MISIDESIAKLEAILDESLRKHEAMAREFKARTDERLRKFDEIDARLAALENKILLMQVCLAVFITLEFIQHLLK